VATGTLRGGRRVELDEEVPLQNARVKVTIELLPRAHERPVGEILDEIHRLLEQGGHIPPTREEVDRYIEGERASWRD